MIDGATIKAGVIALLLSLVVSFAFAMPLTLHVRAPGRIEVVARYFCPETGQFAPRYFTRRGGREACLDTDGRRIEDVSTHQKIVGMIGGLWALVLFPLFYLIFKPLLLSNGRASRIPARAAGAVRIPPLAAARHRRF